VALEVTSKMKRSKEDLVALAVLEVGRKMQRSKEASVEDLGLETRVVRQQISKEASVPPRKSKEASVGASAVALEVANKMKRSKEALVALVALEVARKMKKSKEALEVASVLDSRAGE